MEMLVMAVIVLAAFTAVLIPLFRRRPGVGDEREFENIPSAIEPPVNTPRVEQSAAPPPRDDDVEAAVLRYREAVRAGTVCRKCGQANPVGSAYCSDCGARLPLGDAKEFE